MTAVATPASNFRSTDVADIAKMVMVGAVTIVLMALAILGSTSARAENSGFLGLNIFSAKPRIARVQQPKRLQTYNTGSPGKVLARVDISEQRMDVFVNGRHEHSFTVSTGARGYVTPTGSWKPVRMHTMWRSRKYNNAPMPHSVFFHRGYAVHATDQVARLGRPASHGCIRLHPQNARMFFNTVKHYGMQNTTVTIIR